MSQTIDDRVVQLEFDNGDFEKGVQESLTTLQKLKSSLNLNDAANNLTALSNASNRFNLNGISDAVEQVGEKFSYMKYAGLVAISNLVTGAMNAGKKIASALMGPITSGGWNRAMNLEQANFMMKGLLKTDEAVSAVMADVQESVDGTAYSLDAAAKVAAQFAASGVKAGEGMLPALKAVAGTAAMTNSSFEDIGQIFTTVAGQGKLMTYQMRQLEFRGLNVAATLGEQLGKSEAEIRDMVTKGTISFEMFSDAMTSAFGEHAKEANNTFQGALSNVKSALGRIGAEFATPFIHNIIPVLNSFRLAINATKATLTPFFKESTSMMENLSKRISSAIDQYTEFTKKYGDFIKGLFSDLIRIGHNIFRIFNEALTPIKQAFDETFTKKPLAHFKKLMVTVVRFTDSLKLTEEQTEKVRYIFKGLFSVFDTLGVIVRRVASHFNQFTPAAAYLVRIVGNGLEKISSKLLDLNSKIKSSDFLNGDLMKIPEKFRDVLAKLPTIGDNIKDAFTKIKDVIKNTFSKNLIDPEKFLGNINTITQFFEAILSKVKDIITGIGDLFEKLITTGLPGIVSSIIKVIETLFQSISNAIQNFLSSETLRDLIKLFESGIFIEILKNLLDFSKKLKEKGGLTSIFSFMPQISAVDLSGLNSIAATFKDLAKNLTSVQTIKVIGPAMLEIAAAMLIIASIDDKKIAVALGALTAMIAEFTAMAKLLAGESSKINIQVFSGMNSTFLSIATTILVLAGSLAILAKIDPKRLAAALGAISAIMGTMVFLSSSLFERIDKLANVSNLYDRTAKGLSKMMTSFSKVLFKFAASILVLAAALKIISTIPLDNLIDGLIALTVVMGELVIVARLLPADKNIAGVGKGLQKMAVGIVIIAAALKIMASISPEGMNVALNGLTVSLLAMVGSLGILAAISRLAGGINYKPIATALARLSVAIIMLAAALKIMSTIDMEDMNTAIIGLSVGLGAMVAAFAILATVSKLAGGKVFNFNFKPIALALIELASAIVILSVGLKIMSAISMDDMNTAIVGLVTGLFSMVAALASLAVVAKLASKSDLLAAAASLLIVSGALLVLSTAMSRLSKIPADQMATALASLITSLLTISILLGVLSGVAKAFGVGSLVAAAGAIVLVSVAVVALSIGLATLAAAGSNSLIAVVALAGAFMALGVAMAAFSAAWAPILIGAGVLIVVLAAIGAGLAIVGGGIMVIGKGLSALAVGIVAMKAAMDGITVTNADLLKLTGILLMLAPIVVLISASLVALGAGLAVVGVGLGVIAIAGVIAGAALNLMGLGLNLIATGLTNFVKALINAGTTLTDSKDQLDAFIAILLKLSVVALLSPLILLLGVSLIALGAGLTLTGTGLTLVATGMNLFMAALLNLSEFLQIAIPLVKQGLANAFEFLKEKVRAAWEFIKNIDWEAVLAVLKKVGAWLVEKAKQLWAWIKEKFPVLVEFIKEKLHELGEKIKEKIQEKWGELKELVSQKWQDFKNRMSQWKTDLVEKGKFIIQGLIDGIKSKMKELANIPGQIKDWIVGGIEEKFDINSPSKVTYWDGFMIGEGLNEGLEDSTEETSSIVDNLGNVLEGGIGGIVDTVKDKVTGFFSLDLSKASKDAEGSLSNVTKAFSEGKMSIQEWTDTGGQAWDRIKQLKDELNRLAGEYDAGRMSQEEYENATKSLEDEIYRLIGNIEDLQSALAAIDDEIRLATNENAKYNDMVRQGTMQQSVAFAITQKNTKAIHDLNEMKYNLTGNTKKATDAAKEETKAIDANTTATTKNTGSKKEAKNAEQEFQESLQKTLEGQMNIFDKFEVKQAKSKEEILANMRSQIEGMANWAAQMNKLAEMGIDKGLYQKLAEMGPQGAEYVGAFTQMTAEELAQANDLWAQSLVLPSNVSANLAANFQNIGTDVMKGLNNGLTGPEAQQAIKNAEENGLAVEEAEANALGVASPSWKFHDIGAFCMQGLRRGLENNANLVFFEVKFIGEHSVALARVAFAEGKFAEIGKQVCAGLLSGIESNEQAIYDKLDAIGQKADETLRKVTAVESPSKVFMEIGKYWDLGLAKGISDNATRVYSSIEDMGNNAIATMKYTVANIAAQINDTIEDPVITPVLDLSKVQAGVKTLNSTFSANQARVAAGSISDLQNGQYTASGNIIFNQNNYSPKSLSRIDIYRDTRNLFAQAKGALS